MTFQNYKGLNSTFNTEEVEAPEINENLCFNSELIKQNKNYRLTPVELVYFMKYFIFDTCFFVCFPDSKFFT